MAWWGAFLVIPLIAMAAIYGLEAYLLVFNGGGVKSPSELEKRAMDLNVDTAKTFTTYSLTVLGGVAYYIRARSDDFAPFSRRSAAFTVGVVAASILSIVGGHLWLAQMRDQFANNWYSLLAPTPFTPEALQYDLFIVSLVWFALLVVDRETSRPKAT
jgi:hypothetical protein